MKKIVSNVLIVSTQLIVGGLFLFMLFSNKTEDNRVVVIENNNLDKMADAVSELFVVDHAVNVSKAEEDAKKEEELKSEQQRIAEEEKRKAEEAEAARIAQEEAERKAQEEAAAKKAQEEEAARKAAAVSSSSNSVSALQSYAHNLVINTYGWSEEDYNSLVLLWNAESGWRVNAKNALGAYGIPQSYPGSKMASAGSDWETNGETQIRWGLSYISGRYGTPSAAWLFFQQKGHY